MKTLQMYLKKGADELGIDISSEQLESFTIYANELRKWNRKINLTSITLPEEIAIKHFVDSLALSKYQEMHGNLLDIGSGGGFPAIPIKIKFPDIRVVSVDAVEKKIHFQRHVARTLGLTGFTALHCRVENLSLEYEGAFSCIVSRAFAEITEFVKHACPLLEENGVIVAMKGRDGRREAEEATEALGRMDVVVTSIHEFQLPIYGDARSLIRMRRR